MTAVHPTWRRDECMRRIAAVGILMVGIVLASARPASAQGFWRWLESLSGPGPSHGGGIEIAVLCTGFAKDRAVDADATATSRRTFASLSCGRLARNRVRTTVGFAASFLSGDNTLQYDPGTPVDQTDTVRISTWMGIVDIGVHRAVEIGFGAGVMRFSHLPVSPFTRLAIQPVRVSWKPLAMRSTGDARRDYRNEFLVVRLDATVIPGGLEAEDFGALPGTFKTPRGEILGSYSILINVLPLLGR